MTPAAVHHGLGPQIFAQRQRTLTEAYAKHPERFVRRHPAPPRLPEAVWINPPNDPSTGANHSSLANINPQLPDPPGAEGSSQEIAQ